MELLIVIIFFGGIVYGFISTIVKHIKYSFSEKHYTIDEQDEKDEIKQIRQTDKIENYDKQIDGYMKLIKLLDDRMKRETDPKKKTVLLSKQLSTLEKLNNTITKLEKLE